MAGRHSLRHPERLSLNCFVLRQGKTSIASRMSYSAYLEAATEEAALTAVTSSAMNCLQWPQGAAFTAMRLRPRSPCHAAMAIRNCSACTECCSGKPGNSRFTPAYRRPDTPSPIALQQHQHAFNGDQRSLCVHRLLQWQARELQSHASIQAA